MLSRLERRRDWQIALYVTAALRVAYSVVAAIASQVLHPDAERIHTNFTGDLTYLNGPGYALLGIWQRFDALLYLHIARFGYDRPALSVFYPLYPMLIRALSPILGPLLAALLISTVSAFFLFWGFLRIAAIDLPKPLAIRALLLYAVWPASFILFAGYAESLTIALVIWAVYFARKNQWFASGTCGFLAGMARASGGLVSIPLFLIAWQQRKQRPWPVLLAPFGAVVYPLWLHWSGHTSIVESYQSAWKIQVAPPWITAAGVLRALVSHPDAIFLLSVLLLVAISLLSVASRFRPEYLLYSIAVILQILTRFEHPLLLGVPRYLLLVFPAFIALGALLGKWSRGHRFFWPLWGLLLFSNLGWMWAFLNWSLHL